MQIAVGGLITLVEQVLPAAHKVAWNVFRRFYILAEEKLLHRRYFNTNSLP
jgi:hypothetical protein